MSRVFRRLVLSVGFLAVTLGVYAARSAPAGSYERSIYAATPTTTWVTLGFAFVVAIVAAVAWRGSEQVAGIGLGGLSMVSVVAIPALRNYSFQGMGDALTHLGWARDILWADMRPEELFYPGLHSLTVIIERMAGVELERAMILAVIVLFVPFVIFVPLVVRDVTGNPTATGIAAVFSWLLLPINNVATHMGAHTNSNALYLVPAVLFVVLAYLHRETGDDRLPFGASPFGLLIIVLGAGLLLVHPQQMINVVVVLTAIVGAQFLARRRYDDHPISGHASIHAHTTILGVAFVLWAMSKERFRNAVSGLVYGLLTADIGGSTEVDQREASLTAIGGSLTELFVLLFLVSAIVGLVAAGFVLLSWLGATSLDPQAKSLVTYLGVSLVPLGGMFAAYFFGTPTMAFRQVGFIYVILTILGAIGLAHAVGWFSGPLPTGAVKTVTVVFLVACLGLSLVTVFASPIIYTPSQHVSDPTVHGYETALDTRDHDVLFSGLGFGVDRYGDALEGVEGTDHETYSAGINGQLLVEEFEDGEYDAAYHDLDEYYVVVTEYDQTREFDVYDELHHTEAALAEFEDAEGVDRVVSNDEFDLYVYEDSQSEDEVGIA